MKMTYQPANVTVTDDRQTVPGALVRIELDGQIFEDTVIPKEGEALDCWVGPRLVDVAERDRDLAEELDWVARLGKSGEMQL